MKIENNKRFGLIDNKGVVVFKPKFDFLTGPDKNGYYFFNEDTLTGFIDNNHILHYSNYKLESFNEGLASFKVNNKYGFMDILNRIKIKPIFCSYLNDSVFADDIIEYEQYPFFSEGLCSIALSFSEKYECQLLGYIDKIGRVIFKPKWFWASPFKEGLAFVIDSLGNRNYIDKQGRIVITLHNKEFGCDFSYNRALVCNEDSSSRRFYFIDKTGAIKSLDFEDAGDFHEEVARVREKGKWGFIDLNGQFVIAPKYIDVSDFSEGFASATIIDSDNVIKTGIIDIHEKFVLLPEANIKYGEFKCGIVAKYLIDGYNSVIMAYVDRYGKIIWSK